MILSTDLRSSFTTAQRRRWQVALLAVGLVVAVVLAETTIGRFAAIAIVMVLSLKWPVDRLIVSMVVIFIAVDDPASGPYNDLWESPIQHIGNFWFHTVKNSIPFLPIPLAPMLIVSLVVFVRAVTGRVGPDLAWQRSTVRLPRSFGDLMTLAFVVIPVMAVWGAVSGGSVQQMYYQIFGIVIALSLAGATARVASPQLASLIWRIVVVLAVYRAVIAIYIYVTIARGIDGDPPLYLTSHYDSTLWVIALVWIASQLLERASSQSRWLFFLIGPVLGVAIVVNNRRLAWVVLVAALVYILLTAKGSAHRRLKSIAGYAVPLVAVYTMAGLVAPPSRVFFPVQALQSVVTGDDRSSQTRAIEEYNLVFSARQSFPLPMGLGHEYIEAVAADDISVAFPQYRYLAHNSMLGMLLLVGPVGLALLLAPLVVCVSAAHRTRKASTDPNIQTAAAMVTATWIAFLLGAWGDLGLVTALSTSLVGVACGLGMGVACSLGDDMTQVDR